jgi:hypothetical protein
MAVITTINLTQCGLASPMIERTYLSDESMRQKFGEA